MAFSVFCPECSSSLEVEEEHREWTVRCPHCRHEFRPSKVTGAAPEPNTFAMLEEDDEDGDERPARRRRRRSRRRNTDPAAGARDVATPGVVLELIGWVSLVLVVGLSVFLIIAGVIQQDQPQQQQNQDPPEMFIFMGFCIGIFAVPYFAIIAIGARKMRNLSSYSWSMTACIMAIASIVLFGLCGLPIIAPGIWALVVLVREDVKAAFDDRQRGYWLDDDDDDD